MCGQFSLLPHTGVVSVSEGPTLLSAILGPVAIVIRVERFDIPISFLTG